MKPWEFVRSPRESVRGRRKEQNHLKISQGKSSPSKRGKGEAEQRKASRVECLGRMVHSV